MRVTAEQERALIVRVLAARGAPDETAAVQASWLVEADLRGQHSHGLRRLPVIAGRIERGLLDPAAGGSRRWQRPSFLLVDGERGFGPVVAMGAIGELLDVAGQQGVAIAAVHSANHLGILAPYVEAIADRALIGIALTTSEALVHPFGGRKALLGTNPIAIAVPAEPEPLVLDMATGEVSMGRVLHHLETGQRLPSGWALDESGEATTDPAAASRGSIAPFGGAKGYALGLAFEVLVGALTASALGTEVHGTLDTDKPANKGDLFLCLDPRAGSGDAAAVSRYLAEVRATAPQSGVPAVRVPGDRTRLERARSAEEGIEIADSIWLAAEALAGGGAAA